MGPIVISQIATGLGFLAGAALIKSAMDPNQPMIGPFRQLRRQQPPRCSTCNGTGRVECLCSKWSDGDVGCRTCNGSGRMACNKCGGSGTGRPIMAKVQFRNPRNGAAHYD